MKFRIEKVKNRKHDYKLFFTTPTEAETEKAFQRLLPACQKLAVEQFSGNRLFQEQVDKELEMIEKTKSAVIVEIATAVADFSYEYGYPVALFGEESGLSVMWLLGISNVDPRQYEYRILPSEICIGEFMKNGFSLTLAIEESVKDTLERHLNHRFADVECVVDDEKHIALPCSAPLEKLGRIADITKNRNGIFHRESRLYICEAVWDICEKEFGGKIDIKNPRSSLDAARLYAYARCTAKTEKNGAMFADLKDYIFREDFYKDFLYYGLTKEDALTLSKQGVRKRNKEKVLRELSKYQLPKHLLFAFGELQNIWSVAPCLSRLNIMFQISYYEEQHPEAFE